MAEDTQEKQATSQKEVDATIDSSDETNSQEPGKEQNESSDKTEQDVIGEERRKAKSDFDKQTALLDKFSKSPVIKDRLQNMVDEALTAQETRQTQTVTSQSTPSDDGEDVATKADLLAFQQNIQGMVTGAVEAPNKRAALADIGSFLKASMEAGSITEQDSNRVQAVMHLLGPESNIKIGWDEANNLAREFLQGKAALNILDKMKTTDVSKLEKKQAAMKDMAQPDSASTAQPAKEKDSPEDKILAEFKKFHDNKSIFAKQ